MSIKLKLILKYCAVFIIGLLVGAFLIEALEIHLRPAYRNLIIRTHFKVEQEFLASRALRERRSLDVAFHRWAVVNAETNAGFRIFQEHDARLDSQQYSYLFALFGLKWMSLDENFKKGKKIVEGYDRGKLAVALEDLGQRSEARKQWKLAQSLLSYKSLQETKKSVYSMLELEKSELYKKAERTVLDK